MEPTQDHPLVHEPTAQPAQFFEQLIDARERLLLLDYDGTLAPFQIDPAQATPYRGVCEVLDNIMRDDSTRVVIITGRPARELPMLLDLRRLPEIWGSYGWERLSPDGDYRCGPLDASAFRLLTRDSHWIGDIERAGGRVERKLSGFAIHWRGLAPEQVAAVRETSTRHWHALALEPGLQWEEFDGGVEWKLSGRNKGHAVQMLLHERPDALAAYLGDDLADEEAFRVLRGRGLGVLVRPERRPTFAEWWLRPPDQLLEFLALWYMSSQEHAE